MAIEINIAGTNPVAEVVTECRGAGWPIGTPIKAYGQYKSIGLLDGDKTYMRGIWHYIWMGSDVRLPNDLESYLFR